MVIWRTMILFLLMAAVSSASSTSHKESEMVICFPDERDALLSFKTRFPVQRNISFWKHIVCPFGGYATTEGWKKKGNCCEWDGVTCDSITNHVVELDLSCSFLSGSFPSNTTFLLPRRLRHLSLAFNSFSSSPIPSDLGQLSDLEVLDLSNSGFSGQLPLEIGWLSHLQALDLSFNSDIKIPNLPAIIANLTDLRILDLSFVNISHLPPNIFNLSKLASLVLDGCGLEDELPTSNMVSTSMLPGLTKISLAENMLSGVLPGWIFTLSSLETLYLNENLFTMISEFEIGDDNSSLTVFNVEANRLQGKIPGGIFDLLKLQRLLLQGNNLTGIIPLSKIHKLQGINTLQLSDNSLSIIDDMVSDSKPSWPTFIVLSLSSCNLGHFPDFLRYQANLTVLELSDNGIHGVVPYWLLSLGALERLNISHNLLHGGLEHIPWQIMQEIDIQHNLFHGPIPVPSSTTNHFWASYNRFSGGIPTSFCDSTSLELVVLSGNNLFGSIPDCFASLISNNLYVLDLRQNQLQGEIPSFLFQKCPNLLALSLSGNKLDGQIPESMKNCLHLQLLDLSSNNLKDTFPQWLGVLPSLQVLILGTNKLHGSLMAPNTANSFSSLQILDISRNEFTGYMPVDLLMSMKSMVEVNNTIYFPYLGGYRYQESIMEWVKGITRRIDAIYYMLVVIDVSWNMLEGPIPEPIGDLVSLLSLNLAHNNFIGHIPSSLSNLSMLESLDLSSNRLDGGIPTELVNLNSLAFFNVSENNLVGPVPTGKQFDTFLDPSYLGNPGLCGPLLTNKCWKSRNDPTNSEGYEESGDESSGLHVWEIFLMGSGSGVLVGLAWGYFIFWVNSPYWVQWLIVKIESLVIVHQRGKRHNKRRAKKRDT